MNLRRWWDTTFAVELLLLAVAAPFLYFPERFPAWTAYASMGGLALGWAWRRWRLGLWFRRTPADWPIFFLFLVMLPISLWAAPEPLRIQYSIPKAYILVWNFFLFWTIVTHASRSWALAQVAVAGFIAAGMAIAVLAPLGMDWLYKYPGIDAVLRRIPSPLVGVFAGADSGFHPNQVAGTLLYVLPLLLALAAASLLQLWRAADRRAGDWLLAAVLAGCSAVMGGVFLLTQSRSGLAGLAVGVAVMVLIRWRWGRWVLVVGLLSLVGVLVVAPDALLQLVADAPPAEALGGTNSLGFRQEVWSAAVTALHDFPFTGMGLGTFREIVRLLYPLNVALGYDIGHAHNFVLQTGLDWGVPGMIALLALLILVLLQAVHAHRLCRVSELTSESAVHGPVSWNCALSAGFLGCLAAQAIHGQLDAVAMGAKTNVQFWYLAALIVGIFSLQRILAEAAQLQHHVCDEERVVDEIALPETMRFC